MHLILLLHLEDTTAASGATDTQGPTTATERTTNKGSMELGQSKFIITC